MIIMRISREELNGDADIEFRKVTAMILLRPTRELFSIHSIQFQQNQVKLREHVKKSHAQNLSQGS